ncbi:MAG: hypothetical protein EAZ89_00365 [Bacteroidetes bacterium]|nr:MAG: hypothetical protein EAZ89_00365 [Bacteroidota bacterium]
MALAGSGRQVPPALQPVNPVIGDESFVATFGRQPRPEEEQLRVYTHLRYVEQLLRKQSPAHLSEAQQQQRSRVLDHLKAYYERGVFPANYDYPGERKPCFIDRDGNICAVGYLVEQTAGRALAEAINQRHQYSRISEMKDLPELSAWAESAGLTLRECAMIQPEYVPPGAITKDYATRSALVGGLNIATTLVQQKATPAPRWVSVLGMAGGAFAFYDGYSHFIDPYYGTYIIPQGENTLSLINMASGSTAFLLSTWHLFHREKASQNRKADIGFFQTASRTGVGSGIVFTRRF